MDSMTSEGYYANSVSSAKQGVGGAQWTMVHLSPFSALWPASGKKQSAPLFLPAFRPIRNKDQGGRSFKAEHISRHF